MQQKQYKFLFKLEELFSWKKRKQFSIPLYTEDSEDFFLLV